MLGLLDHPEVAAVLDDELDLLMVDEFQDTSPIQLALFLKLARFAKKVYWVGDIKQAIYGFRGSDTELMQAILQALPRIGGTKEVLPSSWRSRPELVKTINAVFTHAFENSLPKEEVELKPERNESMTGPALANWILGGKNAGLEASALAAGVQKLIDSAYVIYDKPNKTLRPVRFGDVAILSRSHEGVKSLAAALVRAGYSCRHGATGSAGNARSYAGPGLSAPTQRSGRYRCYGRDRLAGRWFGARTMGD